jgi:hypothetical protein
MIVPYCLRQFRFPILAAGALLLLLNTVAPAPAVSINVNGSLNGTTPEIVGYNSGHFMPGSNSADWWRYSGVNGARVWVAPTIIEEAPGLDDDNAWWGDGVGTQQQFIDRRALLRANPLSTSYINWPFFQNNYENNYDTSSTGNHIRFNHTFGALRNLGIDPLVNIQRTNGSFPFDPAGTTAGWADRWEHWQHYYAQAFYLARYFDVHRFQMYNEPNGDDIPADEWLERLRFASDAVQAAVADVNALYGKSLDPQVQAPVTAGNPVTYYNTWGKPAMQNLHTTLFGTTDPNFQLIDTYAYQRYDLSADSFGNELTNVKNLVNADAGGAPMRFALTEFNVHTAGNFDEIAETLDTPSKSSRYGSILAQLANNRPDELYAFKFSQTAWTGASGVKKNGTHYVDNNSSPYNIGGVTKGGEVVRLFAKAFAGQNDLFFTPAILGTGAGDLRMAGARDADENHYYLFSANEGTSSRSLSINLANWQIPGGTQIMVEEVSADRHGEVSQILTLPSNRILDLTQPAQSVLLFSIPKNAPTYVRAIGASADALVAAGTSAGQNFGASPDLFAKNDAASPSARNVSFVKFNTGSIVTSEVERAVLQMSGENMGSASQVIAHVFGIASDNWNESTINWNNAPNLKDSNGTAVDDISENFIEDAGNTAKIVGHFTGVAGSRTLALDVTDFVRDHPDQDITFLIAREVRFDGENVDDALTSLRLASKERGTSPGPQLLVSLSAFALPGDYDHNGTVTASDHDVWRLNFGSTTNPDADGNQDGVVDTRDYIVWRNNFGNSLPGTPAGSAFTAVPEPTTMVLALIGIFAFYAWR